MSNQGKYCFPRFSKVILRDFSLYSKDDEIIEIDEDINSGVYCLAGANGLGKTTFLNAINYGLTGIVLAPDKEVLDPKEIVTNHKRYTDRYFQGRISEKNLPTAEIELQFKVNDKCFRIIRSFENRDELRVFELYTVENDKKISLLKTDNLSPKELVKSYEKVLPTEVGIDNFDYFMFYQLYVLTFDENRRMIFWDDRASSHALSIAFNTDTNQTERIIELKRLMEKHESNGRNARWQATQIKNEISTLKKASAKKNPSSEEQKKEFDKKHKQYEEIEKEFKNISTEYDTMLKQQSYLNSEIMQLRMEHSKLFSQYTKPRSHLLENTFIKTALEENSCAICGTHSSEVTERIIANLHKNNCPLCDTAIEEGKDDKQDQLLEAIKVNDDKIAKSNKELEKLTIEVQGKKSRLEKTERDFNKIKEELDKLIAANPDISFEKTGNQSVDVLLEQYQKQFDKNDKKAKEEYALRDKLKPEYNVLLEQVDAAYKEAEIVFVPIFKSLAKSFIGLDLNIQSERSGKSIYLVLELQKSARTESSQLSESQRFFLDIALRMSLAIYLSRKGSGATMLIDTPEGSLDIAYESRVGKMFADFVVEYEQHILMTANINASQLLISLAERCRNQNMKFRRMLEWTDPTPIQKEGEYLFDQVYSNIETALSK